jgi:glycosyltransferase involved in cell wall biosynthesis
MGLEQCVEFIGQSDDIPTLLADSTLLAHTSAAEGCPNVVMEAMACGRPVVATDAGDVSSLVDDGKTGYVVEQADDRALVDRIATLIVNREICWQMGAAGRAKAEREFGAKHLVDGTLKAYQAAGWKK